MASQLGLCVSVPPSVSQRFTSLHGDDVAVRHAARLRLTNPPNVAVTLIERIVWGPPPSRIRSADPAPRRRTQLLWIRHAVDPRDGGAASIEGDHGDQPAIARGEHVWLAVHRQRRGRHASTGRVTDHASERGERFGDRAHLLALPQHLETAHERVEPEENGPRRQPCGTRSRGYAYPKGSRVTLRRSRTRQADRDVQG